MTFLKPKEIFINRSVDFQSKRTRDREETRNCEKIGSEITEALRSQLVELVDFREKKIRNDEETRNCEKIGSEITEVLRSQPVDPVNLCQLHRDNTDRR
ncbi:MAG: hypothetical protein AB4290_17835 [Spirulina sp.]